jgi:hypothetical protein
MGIKFTGFSSSGASGGCGCCGGVFCHACGGINLTSGSITDGLGTTQFVYSLPHLQWEANPISTFSVEGANSWNPMTGFGCGTFDENYGYSFICNPDGTVTLTMYSWASGTCATLYSSCLIYLGGGGPFCVPAQTSIPPTFIANDIVIPECADGVMTAIFNWIIPIGFGGIGPSSATVSFNY